MDFLDLLRIAFRRFYVVVPAVALSIFAAMTVSSSVQATYKSTGSILLFAPIDPDVRANRLLGFNSLEVPATITAQVVGDEQTRRRLAEEGASVDYQLGLDPSNPAPLIGVVAEGGREQAPLTVSLVMAEVSAELERRQLALGAPPQTWITTEVVSPPQAPVLQTGSRTRAFIAVLLLGLGATGGLTVVFDLALYRRRLRRAARRARREAARSEPERETAPAAEPHKREIDAATGAGTPPEAAGADLAGNGSGPAQPPATGRTVGRRRKPD